MANARGSSEEEEDPFHEALEKLKKSLAITSDTELTTEHLKDLVKQYKALIAKLTREAFPQDVMQQ